MPPIRLASSTNAVIRPSPYWRARLAVISARSWSGNGSALATWALCWTRSWRTSRAKRAATVTAPGRPDARSRATTSRARLSSSAPSTRQRRNSCRASRCACFGVFMSARLQVLRGTFRQTPLIVRRHDAADDRGGRLHHQPSDFAAQFGQHPLVFLRRDLSRLDHDLFRGGDRALRLVFLHAPGDRAPLGEQLRRLRLRVGHHLLPLRLDAGERGVDLPGVLEALRDLLPPFLEQA